MSVLAILNAAHVACVDERVDPRPGQFEPAGIICHHTANPQKGDLPSLKLLQKGRADLRGPLCNIGAGRAGTLAVITDGRANHAGKGDGTALSRVRYDLQPFPPPGPDDTDGNHWFIGIEIENAGDGHDPYTDAQWHAVTAACAALCHHYGWSANRVIGHKEWTRRKIDPTFDMVAMRAGVARLLAPPPLPQLPEDDDMIIRFSDKSGADPTQLLALDGKLYVIDDGDSAKSLEAAGVKVVALGGTDYAQMRLKAEA